MNRWSVRIGLVISLLWVAGLLAGPAFVRPAAAQGAANLTAEDALKLVSKIDKSLAPLENNMNAAHQRMMKAPKDAGKRAAYVNATYTYGHSVMMDRDKIGAPRIQYRAALALYRRALAVDPRHKPSLTDKKMIEDIYKSMPGGIPK